MMILEIKRKDGWVINPDDKRLNSIIKAIYRNDGNCPCQKGCNKCPCSSYTEEDNCHCGLYIKL